MADQTLRLFVAATLPRPTSRQIGDFVDTLRPLHACRFARSVRPHNLHVTLRFLGDTPDHRVEALQESLRSSGVEQIASPLAFKGLAAFPRRRPRVLALEPDDSAAATLAQMHERVSSALEAVGVPPDDRPFQGHLTLVRFKRPPRRVLLDELAAIAPPPIRFAPAVELLASTLHPTGPAYATLLRLGDSAPAPARAENDANSSKAGRST